jgi:uncharacterized protein
MAARALSFRRIAILSSGWIFVGLGLVGLFLPFLQGVLFLAVGIYLLSLESARMRLMRQRLRRRYAWLDRAMRATEDRFKAWRARRG